MSFKLLLFFVVGKKGFAVFGLHRQKLRKVVIDAVSILIIFRKAELAVNERVRDNALNRVLRLCFCIGGHICDVALVEGVHIGVNPSDENERVLVFFVAFHDFEQ